MNEADFKALVSGERRGALASLFRAGLRGLSFGYLGGSVLRNRLFDAGLKKSHHPGVPVVSVGNITTGGTGKTPMVAFLANWFREQGAKLRAQLFDELGKSGGLQMTLVPPAGEVLDDRKLPR